MTKCDHKGETGFVLEPPIRLDDVKQKVKLTWDCGEVTEQIVDIPKQTYTTFR